MSRTQVTMAKRGRVASVLVVSAPPLLHVPSITALAIPLSLPLPHTRTHTTHTRTHTTHTHTHNRTQPLRVKEDPRKLSHPQIFELILITKFSHTHTHTGFIHHTFSRRSRGAWKKRDRKEMVGSSNSPAEIQRRGLSAQPGLPPATTNNAAPPYYTMKTRCTFLKKNITTVER